MKRTLTLLILTLLALSACAGTAQEAPAVEQTRAQGDGYALTYDATAMSFYRDGVTEGVDLIVPTQDVVSPAYLMISRLESVQAEQESLLENGYSDEGEIALASGLTAHAYAQPRSGVNYAAYILEQDGRAYSILTVCSQESPQTEAQLRAVVDTFAFDDAALET